MSGNTSNNISYRTSSLIEIIFWGSLAYREAVTLPLTVKKPCRVSWNWIADVRQKFNIPVTIFQRTPNNPILRKLLFPFGIKTTVYQAHSSAR